MIEPGATVTEGQPVMELETDKAVIEVPSSVSGTVKEIRVKEGDKLKVGQVIFTLDNGATGKVKAESAPAKSTPAVASPSSPAVETPRPAPAPPVAETPPSQSTTPSSAKAKGTSASEFKLPELGENIHQGDLVRL